MKTLLLSIFLCLSLLSESPNKSVEFERVWDELELIQNTIDWSNDYRIIRDMNSRRWKIINNYLYENI